MSNRQLLTATGAWVFLSLLFWILTRTSAFSLIWSISLLAFATAIYSFFDLRTYLEFEEFDVVASWFLLPGLLLLTLSMYLDLKWRAVPLAVPTYIIGVGVSLAALTVIASNGSTSEWLGMAVAAKQDNVAYSMMINGGLYCLFGFLAEKSVKSRLLRRISVLLFWLAPTHLLAPLFYLACEHKWIWSALPSGWTLSEIVLPLSAVVFTMASVPRQMKSFFFSGLFYLALSLVWLTYEHFRNNLIWPIAIFAVGLLLIGLTWRYPKIMK